MRKKWKGYAKMISGYGGEMFALFVKGKRTGTSSMVGTRSYHEDMLRVSGYKIRKGYVKE